MLIGEGIKERQALSCNPFGGASDCVTLPVTTTYADACGITEAKVSTHDFLFCLPVDRDFAD